MFSHFSVLLNKCTQFREEGSFTDVQLKVGKTVFPAHRMLLAAYSDYFYAMFTNGMKESNQEVIELKDESMSPETLKQIIDFIYSGHLRVNRENVFQVLAAADHLQVTSVLQQCCDFLKKEALQLNLDVRRFCSLCAIAEKYGLRELREAAEHQMALNYKDVCESEEFLTHIGADQLLSLLSRDDLSAPSETFVFKSVMQWIKYKQKKRMAVAAKVIEAVRLGLVDIEVLIHELNTWDMQRLPAIHTILFDASIYFHVPSQVPRFAEKSKPRTSSQVLLAISPRSPAKYFDVVTKGWKEMTSSYQLSQCVYCAAEPVGNDLYVAVKVIHSSSHVYCYNIDLNLWEKKPSPPCVINSLCAIGDYMYSVGDYNEVSQRYSFSQCRWEPIAKLSLYNSDTEHHFCAGATVFNSKLYVIYGCAKRTERRDQRGSIANEYSTQNAKLYCFDPRMNRWQFISSTCHPHFGSTLFVVGSKLCVAGSYPCGDKASVEVYDPDTCRWSIVHQTHIPQNNLGAIEVEGRVYFIINKFPVDSGIKIPPGEVYPVYLGEWENLVSNAPLCYLPVKRKT
ncbi:kelch-like protein 25 [Oculina patagonica]